MTTVTFIDFNVPCAASALSACTMMTLPPFMSMMPGPRASFSPRCSTFWNGLSASKTVSRWPMRRILGPGPGCSATRCPARLKGAPSTQRVLNPRASNSCRKILPTSCTPLKFWVPLLMLTTRSSSASACGLSLSMNSMRRCSSAEMLRLWAVKLLDPVTTVTSPKANPSTRFEDFFGVWRLQFEVVTRQLLYSSQFTGQQRHRSEGGLAELSCVNADCPLQAVRERLP